MALAYSSGCRLSELVASRRVNLRAFTRAGEEDTHWEIVVTGKGDQFRTVQLNPQVVEEIRRYLAIRGHTALGNAPPDIPLIAALPSSGPFGSADEPLSASRLYRVLKTFFRDVATPLIKADRDTAQKLQSASTNALAAAYLCHARHSQWDDT